MEFGNPRAKVRRKMKSEKRKMKNYHKGEENARMNVKNG